MPEGNRKETVLIPLASRLERERRRGSNETPCPDDVALETQGWQRRFVADAQRAQEVIELYRQLGFEVLCEAVQTAELGDDCIDCQLVMQREYITIYTRKQMNDEYAKGNS